MIDVGLLVLVVAAATAAGLACLRLPGALPDGAGDALIAGAAVGLGLAGAFGLGLAAIDRLRPVPIAAGGTLALAVGGRLLLETTRAAVRQRVRGRGKLEWALLAVCALVLASEVVVMLAPPVGGDQTKYHLPYPRLYAAHGGLVDTPWSFWGHMQFLQNFLFAIAFALRGDVLARLLNGAGGLLATLALARLATRHFGRRMGLLAGALYFTLPISWSMMARAGNDLPVILYGALATDAILDWVAGEREGDFRRAAMMAGLAGASKSMGLLVPALVGLVVLAVLVRRASAARLVTASLTYGALVLALASPCYVRNAVETGNPLYPFGYGVFGGKYWSRAASDYLALYYAQYQTTYAKHRGDIPYAGLAVLRFPWDMTMYPGSFERNAREAYDVGPFALAFAPALVLVRRRRTAVLVTAALGFGYAGIIAGAAWAHPRYVLPGAALLFVAIVPAARALAGRTLFPVLVAVTLASNLAVTSRLLRPMWYGQLGVVLGRLSPADFLRAQSPVYAFWERANPAVPDDGRVLVLEKIPHPYYIERPFVLASYLEQDLIDYHRVTTPEALAVAASDLGVTHVAIDLAALDADGDPFEATVARLWRAFVETECDPVLRESGYALLTLRPPSALAAGDRRHA